MLMLMDLHWQYIVYWWYFPTHFCSMSPGFQYNVDNMATQRSENGNANCNVIYILTFILVFKQENSRTETLTMLDFLIIALNKVFTYACLWQHVQCISCLSLYDLWFFQLQIQVFFEHKWSQSIHFQSKMQMEEWWKWYVRNEERQRFTLLSRPASLDCIYI